MVTPPHHPHVHSTFFGANGTDSGKLQPKADANGNCGADDKVSLLCFVFSLVQSEPNDAKLIFHYADSR